MMEPHTFEIEVHADGTVGIGRGVLIAFVPPSTGWPAVVAMSADPRHDPGRPIADLAPECVAWLVRQLGPTVRSACWTLIDGYGRFIEAVADWPSGTETTVPVTTRRFPQGLGIDAFYAETGGAGEAAIELLSGIIEGPLLDETTPPMEEFLGMIETHGNLPAPGAIFRKVDVAARDGDSRQVVSAVQHDPVIVASIVTSANAARFIASGKTASVPESVNRLGTSFVRRIVFVADMVSRYRKGACARFDYRAYWLNAIATGAAMRGLLETFGLPPRKADEAFTIGLLSGIGWLVIAETYPVLMTRYLELCQGVDPVGKARIQAEIFPCPIRIVSERYLERYEFPDEIRDTIVGRWHDSRDLYDCLARAIRVAQSLSPFACHAVPTNVPAPESCQAEWVHWQHLFD